MADVENGYGLHFIVDFINHPVISNAKAPAFSPSELPAPTRSLVFRKREDGSLEFFVGLFGQRSKLTLSPAEDEDGITHLRERSIS